MAEPLLGSHEFPRDALASWGGRAPPPHPVGWEKLALPALPGPAPRAAGTLVPAPAAAVVTPAFLPGPH